MSEKQQAYRLAPWKKQARLILRVALALVFVSVIVMIYLSVSAELTRVKMETEVLHEERNTLLQDIANGETQEGKLTAYNVMKERAKEAGYFEVDTLNEDVCEYVVVDGYTGKISLDFKNDNSLKPSITSALIKPEYTISLQQWLLDQLKKGRPDL